MERVRTFDEIVHGSHAMNIQLPKKYRRRSRDWDIYASNPYREMDEMEDILDECIGCDAFHENVLSMYDPYMGHKYVYQVVGPWGEVVDYTIPPSNVKTKRIRGIRYEDLMYKYQKLKMILHNPYISEERRRKTLSDLRRIERYLRSKRRKHR